MYNCNTDSLGLILGVEVFFSEGHCSGALWPTSAFTFKTLLRHYAIQALTPRSLNVKLCPRHQGKAIVGAFSVITNHRMDFFEALILMSIDVKISYNIWTACPEYSARPKHWSRRRLEARLPPSTRAWKWIVVFKLSVRGQAELLRCAGKRLFLWGYVM